MGEWAHGNFDNDTAADHLSILVARLIGEIAQAMAMPEELEPDAYWGCAVPCNIEILTLLADQRWVGVSLPPPATVAAWKATYLRVWDTHIDELGPSPADRERRRAVLVATFDALGARALCDENGGDAR